MKFILRNPHLPAPQKKRRKIVHMDEVLVFKGLSAPYNSYSNDTIPQEILCPSSAPSIYNSSWT